MNVYRKIVIFEELKVIHRWLVAWYMWRKYEVKYLRMSRAAEFANFPTIFEGKIEQVEYTRKPTTHDGYYYDDAYKVIDAFFHEYYDKPIFKRMAELYRNNAVILAYKKAFNDLLARFYFINHFMNAMMEKYRGDDVAFIPSNGICDYRTEDCEIYDYHKIYAQAKDIGIFFHKTSSMRFPVWCTVKSYINAFIRKCKILGMIFGFLGWCLWKNIKSLRNKIKAPSQPFKYAVAICSYRQFYNKIQTVDFIIDGETIKREEVVFLSNEKLNEQERKFLTDRQLEYFDDQPAFISMNEINRIVPEYISLIFSVFTENSVTLKTSLKGLYFYAIWESLANNLRISNYINHSNYEIKSIFRNILLKNHGCTTYQYMASTNFGYFFTSTKSKGKKSFSLGFFYGDYFVTWNDEVVNFFKFTHCQFKHYINLGCFWTEHVRLITEGKISSDLLKSLEEAGYQPGMRIVSIFDSTANDDSHTTYSDSINFLEGIYLLMQEVSDVFFIFKEKYHRGYHKLMSAKYQSMNALFDKFDQFPRVYMTGNDMNSSEVIAISDVVISSPFTSTTYEAISARRKAIWYDASGKFKQSYYDRVPGLVCHNHADLFKRMNELLFKTTEEDYNKFLDYHVKGSIESFLDGKAITRFRQLLNKSLELPPKQDMEEPAMSAERN